MNSNTAVQQAQEIAITDSQTLKVALHPLRSRLITALAHEPRTVRELASIVNMAPTKLYYHVKLLQKAGFIAVAGERQIGNLTETSYLCTAKNFTVAPELSQGLGEVGAFEKTIASFISTLRASLLGSYRMVQEQKKGKAANPRGKATQKRRSQTFSLGIQTLQLDEGEADAFLKRCTELVKEFDAPKKAGSKARQYEIGFAFYPSASPQDAPHEGIELKGEKP